MYLPKLFLTFKTSFFFLVIIVLYAWKIPVFSKVNSLLLAYKSNASTFKNAKKLCILFLLQHTTFLSKNQILAETEYKLIAETLKGMFEHPSHHKVSKKCFLITYFLFRTN